jgi:hypothetical protein
MIGSPDTSASKYMKPATASLLRKQPASKSFGSRSGSDKCRTGSESVRAGQCGRESLIRDARSQTGGAASLTDIQISDRGSRPARAMSVPVLFRDTEDHCRASTTRSAVVELDRLLSGINGGSGTPHHIGAEHPLIGFTNESAALRAGVTHRADCEIARRSRLSFFSFRALVSLRSPLSLGPDWTLWPLTSEKKNRKQNSGQAYKHFHAQLPNWQSDSAAVCAHPSITRREGGALSACPNVPDTEQSVEIPELPDFLDRRTHRGAP